MTRFPAVAALAVAVSMLQPAPLHAQSGDADGLSAEEIESRFRSQKTRGLVIAPTGGGTAAPDAAATAPAAAAPAADYTRVEASQEVAVRIAFDFDSAALRPDQKPKLATLCQVMATMDDGVFRIVGHTDASGSASYNERLSLLRAEEVKRHMVGECGITAGRLQAVGVGEAYPADSLDPRAEENRRVEFQLVG